MQRICQITGKKSMMGNKVSHAKNKTKRRFNINLKRKGFYVPDQGQIKGFWITLKVSAKGIRTINKLGIIKCISRLKTLN